MLDWIALAPAVVVAAALLVLPGAALVAALGVRGFGMLAASVPVSVTTIAGAATIAPWVGLRWGILPVLATWLALLVLALALHRAVRGMRAFEAAPPWRRRPAPIWPSLIAFIVGAMYVALQVARIPGKPDAFSIRFDNAFHLGATRYALETGNASAFNVSGFASLDGTASLYPAAWHSLMSLLVDLTGVTLPEASNALMIAVATVGWLSGCVFLGLIVSRHRVLAAVGGALLAGCFHVFPYLLLNWGTLYPNFLGVAMLPATLALSAICVRVRGIQPEVSRGSAFLVLGASLPGLLLAHPSTGLVWGLMTMILVAVGLFERAARSTRRGRAVLISVVVTGVMVAALAVVWILMRPPRDESPWGPYRRLPGTVFELFTNSQVYSPIPVSVALVMLVGLGVLIVKRQFAFVAIWVVIGAVFVIAAGAPDGELRWIVSGVFFQDSLRVAALTAVSAMAPAIVGLVVLSRWWMSLVAAGAGKIGITEPRTRARLARSGLALALVLGMGVAYVTAVSPGIAWARKAYTITEKSGLIRENEWEMIQQLPDLVSDDAILIGAPRAGTPFVYALTGIRVAPPYMYVIANDSEQTIRKELNRADDDPQARREVCAAVDDLGGEVYVLDFRQGRYTSAQYQGLNDLRAPVVSKVAQTGDVTLEKVEICDGGEGSASS